MESSYLRRIVKDPLINKNPKCQNLIMESLLYTINKQKSEFKGSKVQPRVRLGLPQFLMVIGGQGPKPIPNVDSFDFRMHRWTRRSDLPSNRCRAGYPNLIISNYSLIVFFLIESVV
jgi:hypothetical protein